MEVKTLTASTLNKGLQAAGLLGLLWLAGGAGQAAPQADTLAGKGDAFLAHRCAAPVRSGWSSVLVKLGGDLNAGQQAQLAALGADVTRRLPFIQSAALRVPTKNLTKLAALPFVAHLSLDAGVQKNDWFTVNSSLDSAAFPQYGLVGTGVTVAVVDSGIHQQSQDLQLAAGAKALPGIKPVSGTYPAPLAQGAGQGRVLYNVSYVPDNPATGTTHGFDDQCGHGTHVAGIIAGNGAASSTNNCTQTFYGVAANANLVNVRVLDKQGGGSVTTVLSGLQWVYYNAAQYNIRVVNLSVGHPVGESYLTDPLCQAVEALWNKGIVVVCAAGNNGRLNPDVNTAGMDNEGWGTGYGSIQSPGNDPYVLTVGATKSMDGSRADDRIATYSSRGPSRLDLVMKPDIIAPGNKVISLDVNGSYLDVTDGGTNQIPQSTYMTVKAGTTTTSDTYFRLSGTSMASPVVAAAAALLLQQNATLSPDTIKARLMLAADKWTAPDGTADPCTYGAGYLNIPAALACPVTATLPALSPTLAQNPDGTVSLVMSRAMWGTSLWGTGVTDSRAMWGKTSLYNSSTLSASRAMWGCSVWGDRAMWGCTTSAVDLTSTAIKGEADVNNTPATSGTATAATTTTTVKTAKVRRAQHILWGGGAPASQNSTGN